MAKLFIGDHIGAHRTTQQIEKWFYNKGHEVHWDTYYEWAKGPLGDPPPHWVEWADVVFFEWCEGQVALCLKDGWGKKKPVFTRAMDIEIWAGQAAREDLTDLTGLVYTSKAYFEVMKKDDEWETKYPNLPTHHIPLSIDMNEWTFKKRKPGYNIGVIGHMWDAKGPNLVPHFARYLIDKTGNKKWKFHLKGHWRHDVWKWYFHWMNYIIKDMGLEDNIILDESHVESMDEWMDTVDYIIPFSMKDAFSLTVGEGLAKGIRTLPYNFEGSRDIWGPYVWTTFDELYDMMMKPYNSNEYRDFVATNYSNEVIMPKWEELFQI